MTRLAISSALLALGLAWGSAPALAQSSTEDGAQFAVEGVLVAPDDDGRGTPFRVDKDDNICGLTEPRQLTHPAKVDHSALLDETSEMKELKRNKIDPNSAKGIELTTKARAKVRDACEKVRGDKAHCSIWKTIERRDKKPLPDVTEAVKQALLGKAARL